MTINNRVVWREGLFLRPQHFQQQERAIERQLEIRASSLHAWGWGFTELELERDLLATGRIAVRRARGVLPDGTPFCMPDDDPVPPALEITGTTRDRTVFLGLPLRRAGALDVGRPDRSREVTRLSSAEIEVRDNTGGNEEPAVMEVATVRGQLLIEAIRSTSTPAYHLRASSNAAPIVRSCWTSVSSPP